MMLTAKLNEVPGRSALPLERISGLVVRITMCAEQVEKFVSRFHEGPSEEGSEQNVREVPRGHNGHIDSLANAAERLEKAVGLLNEIG